MIPNFWQISKLSAEGPPPNIKPAFQIINTNNVSAETKKPIRPNQLSLHDLFSQSDDASSQLKQEPKRPKIETKTELLSTPEGPEGNGHEDFKLHEFLLQSTENTASQPQLPTVPVVSVAQQTPLINQKNAELLNPQKLPKISETITQGVNSGTCFMINFTVDSIGLFKKILES